MEDTATAKEMKDIKLENFSGPLDLLLHLIQEKQMDITTDSLSSVTEQFLNYLQEIDERSPEELASFLVVATKLLLLKSQALLPFLQVEEEENPSDLTTQLKMYKKYATATQVIEEMIAQKNFLFAKPVSKKIYQVAFHPPQLLSLERLQQVFVDVLSLLEPVVKLPKAALAKVVSLREKFVQIQQALEKQAHLNFYQLMQNSHDRSEIVITFLALLELVKQQTIVVKQEKSFQNITIEKI